ncbi:MAG TPA: glycosyltransferase family 4 protein [Luteolibacter sp.]|nr:glycosyltransferase family 4 protein [Luteolibacter sp.]
MNLLYIQKSTGRGGAKNSLLETLAAIRGDGEMHPRVIVGGDGPFTGRCAEMGVPVSVEKLPEWRKFFERLAFSREIRHIAKKHATSGIDWVISNEMWWGPHAAHLARQLGCRSAVVLRDGIATVKKSLQYRLDRNELILPVSSTIARALKSHTTLADRVHVLFNSVSVPRARPEDAAALDGLLQPFSDVACWLLVVGKLGARKNQADAVRVTRSLINAGHSGLGLLLAGDIDPDYRPVMDRTIAECQLGGRVAMIGNFDGLATLLERADMVLLPSFREGLPRSLVEAITAGKPAFSYPCEGVEDIYGVHRSRFVSAESSPEALSDTILRAWSGAPETESAFAEVRREVLENFSPQAHLARLTSLLGATTHHTP